MSPDALPCGMHFKLADTLDVRLQAGRRATIRILTTVNRIIIVSPLVLASNVRGLFGIIV